MAEKKERNNLGLIVGGFLVASVIGVLVLKADEVKHLEMAGAGTTLQGNADALSSAKKFENNFTD
jgi:hypothetical protein